MNRFLLIALAAVALPLAACASDEPDTTVIVDDPAPSTVVVEPMPADPVVVEGSDVIVEQPAAEPMPAPADSM